LWCDLLENYIIIFYIICIIIFIISVKYSELKLLFKKVIHLKKIEDKKNLKYMQSYIFNIKNRFYKKQNIFKYPYKLNGLIRYKSTVASLSNNSNTYRLTDIVNEHIKKGNPTTNKIINNVLLNQKVSITQEELNKLLNLSKIKFDLPITKETYSALLALVDKPQYRRGGAGIYIFTHKTTNNKYVGSSNNLFRRLKQYFEKNVFFNNKITGLLLPLIKKEGFEAFTLEIIVIPSSYPKYSHCFLEQYYLLSKEFNLNKHKIVNFRINQGYKIYLYDLNYKTLYYRSNSLNEFCRDLGIHYSSYKKCIANDSPYLNFFKISKSLITEAIPINLSYFKLRELIIKCRKESLNKLHLSYGKVIEVFDKEINNTMTFTSIIKASYRFGISRTTIKNYITSGKLYKNRYHFKFSDKI